MSEQTMQHHDEQVMGISTMARWGRIAFGVLSWLVFIGVIVQVTLAGSGIFVDYSRFDIHRSLGYFLILPSVLMIVAAFMGHLPRQRIGQSFGLLVMIVLQIVFVEIRDTGLEELAALHVLNAFGIFGNSLDLARGSLAYLRPTPTPEQA